MLIKIWKAIAIAIGGGIGWFVGEFRPTFPLAVVAVIFILSDAWTAYRLDKRVHETYPDKVKRQDAHFTSFAFGKVIKSTIPKRLWLICLAYIAEHWVFGTSLISLSYVVTGGIIFEQAWSMLENECSCRPESDSRLLRALQHNLVDKTERHFDIKLDEFKKGHGNNQEGK